MEIITQPNTFDNKLNDFIKMHDQLSASIHQSTVYSNRYNKSYKHPLINTTLTTQAGQVDGKPEEVQSSQVKDIIRRKIKTLTQTEMLQSKQQSDSFQPLNKQAEQATHKQKDYIIKKVDRSRATSKDNFQNNNNNNTPKINNTSIQPKKDNINISINSININSPQDSFNSTPNQNQSIQNHRVSLYQQMMNRTNLKNFQESPPQQQNNFLSVKQEQRKTYLTPSPRESSINKQNSNSNSSANSNSYMQSIVRTRRFSVNTTQITSNSKKNKDNANLSTSSSNESSEGDIIQTYDCKARNRSSIINNQPRRSIFQQMQSPQTNRRRNTILNVNQQIKNRQNLSQDQRILSENTQNEIDNSNQINDDEENHIFSVAYDSYDHTQLEILNNDEQLDARFLNEFIEINKNYLEDNVQVSLTSDKECVDINSQKNSFIDVMIGIELPEKNEQLISPYVDIFRKNQSDQIRKEDIILQRNQGIPIKNKSFNIKDYISSPYDLIIVIDVNMNEEALQQVLNSIEFIISNSTKHDRISLIIPVGNQILKSNLMRCSTSIKNTLIHVLKKIKPSSRLSNHRAFINALWTINERKQKNFLTSIFWFSYGQINEHLSHQIKEDLLHLNIKSSFSINTFHIQNPKDDQIKFNHHSKDSINHNYLQDLSHTKGGNYYFIESYDQISQFGAKALGFIKTSVGFKASATIIKCIDTKHDKTNNKYPSSYRNELEKKHIYTPIPNLETIFGGDAVWKENTGLHGYSADQPIMNSGISKYFNLRYSFQGTNMRISEEDKEQPIFKAQLFIYHENISPQPKFTFKESFLSLKFRNYNAQNSPQLTFNNNVLKNSYKYRLLLEISNYLKLIENGEYQYGQKKLDEALRYIQNICGTQASIECQSLVKFANSLKNYADFPEEFNANVKYQIGSFLQSHIYQKNEIYQKKMSFETQLSEHYMNYVQFYLQKLTMQHKEL